MRRMIHLPLLGRGQTSFFYSTFVDTAEGNLITWAKAHTGAGAEGKETKSFSIMHHSDALNTTLIHFSKTLLRQFLIHYIRSTKSLPWWSKPRISRLFCCCSFGETKLAKLHWTLT